jgi:hypothetical protein
MLRKELMDISFDNARLSRPKFTDNEDFVEMLSLLRCLKVYNMYKELIISAKYLWRHQS